MSTQELEAFYGQPPIEVGTCFSCSLLWFDQSGSNRLTPHAVLGLFQSMGRAPLGARTPLATAFLCPRCNGALAVTYDLQRTTRFTYWRCEFDHGQLISFTQFLREKNFIRSPSAEELGRLRNTVREISCSQCGAPIDLTKDSACTHCRSPIALIDPDGIAKAVHELTAWEAKPSPMTQEQTSTALGNAQLDALFDQQRIDDREGHHDLLAIGVAAIGALLGENIRDR
jgi:hypothetical protein